MKRIQLLHKYKDTSWLPWLIWAIAASFFFSEYVVRVSPSVMTQDLMQDLKANALTLGMLSACFYYPYVALQIPVGLLVDKFGARRLLYTMATISAIGCIIFAKADSLFIASLARVIIGLTAAFGFVGVIKLAASWHPPGRLGLIVGLTQSSGMLGAFCSAPFAVLVTSIGWRSSILVMAAVLALIAFAIRFLCPKRTTNNRGGQVYPKQGMLASLRIVLSNPQSWYNALFVGLFFLPTGVFGEMWGVTFLSSTYGYPRDVAAMLNGMIFIGWIIGGPFLGWVADRIFSAKACMIVSCTALLLAITVVIYVPNLSYNMLMALLLLVGFSSGGVTIAYTLSTKINIPAVSGTSLAFANMSSVIVSAILLPIVGRILDKSGNVSYINGIPTYQPGAFKYAFIPIVLGLVLGILCAFKIKGDRELITKGS